MPINVFGKSNSNKNGNKSDGNSIVQKSYLRTNYKESNIEEDIDMRNQFEVKNQHCPQETSDAICKSYADKLLNDPSIIRNTAHVDFNDKKSR